MLSASQINALSYRMLRSRFGQMKRWIPIFALLLTVTISSASVPDFSRYRVIIDRKPFGDPPPEPVAPRPTPPVSPERSFARTIRLTALLESADGELRVGLVNSQNNDSFFLEVGETHDGIELVSASYEDEEAVLRRGSEMAIVSFDTGNVEPITQQQHRERDQARQTSYEDRRRARREAAEARRREPPPEPRLTGEELQQHLQDYQMEVIRQGLPPLPIPLTPEMDDQLVSEGVLPP